MAVPSHLHALVCPRELLHSPPSQAAFPARLYRHYPLVPPERLSPLLLNPSPETCPYPLRPLTACVAIPLPDSLTNVWNLCPDPFPQAAHKLVRVQASVSLKTCGAFSGPVGP